MIEIIPAIDIIDGKCVRLTHGDYDRKTVYYDDPAEAAKRFEAAGFGRLHVVDLDGAREGKPANLASLEAINRATSMTIDFGGGIASDDDLASVFGAGAAIANVGSTAVRAPELFFSWIRKYGPDKILLGADARDGKVAIDGWRTETAIDVTVFLRDCFERGVTQAFATDIRSDGALAGPSIELYKDIRAAAPELRLIASGGVASVADLELLDEAGCSGAIIGKAFYEGTVKFSELSAYVS